MKKEKITSSEKCVRFSLVAVLLLGGLIPAAGQQASRVSEQLVAMTTYPFSDPDPVASGQKLYPYFRFDGFSDKPVRKKWKVVILENDYIRVQVMPEIGGKIWTAYDKITGRDFLYNNQVVKFRDIAMRGPWTSGGIEANYGVIGHTPNTSTPVDYLLKTNEDGSASCLIHTLDLLTRSRWTLEIRLEKDKGYFSTRSFWSNTSPVEQPYYSWMNLGIPASDDLQFLYPGHQYIGHDGRSHNWPLDEKGRDLSYYKENAFGDSKSYHVLGARSNTFGAFWASKDYGMARYAAREDKLGKKIFLWAQSGEGQIWEDLLTDHSGQYVEIQSGRLFNQNTVNSSETPFKQVGFAPYQSDRWEEHWLPFHGIGKPTAINLIGAFVLRQQNRQLEITIDPRRPLNDTLMVLDGQSGVIARTLVNGAVGKSLSVSLMLPPDKQAQAILLQGLRLDLVQDHYPLERPVQSAAKMRMERADSLSLLGRDLLRFRLYARAEPVVREAHRLAPYNLEVCKNMARLQWFRMDYDSAYYYSREALKLDTYDGEANYYYGLAAQKLGKRYDAFDGFEVASLQVSWRAAAYISLARLYFGDKDYVQSRRYALDALRNGQENIEALQLAYLSAVALRDEKLKQQTSADLVQLDPFNPMLRYEAFTAQPDAVSKNRFLQGVQQELKTETFLELAAWYTSVNALEKAAGVLEIAPQNAETCYWLAWLHRGSDEGKKWLANAEAADPGFVFPFREESQVVFAWALEQHRHWKTRYLLALLYRYRNQNDRALSLLLENEHEAVDFAPFFAVRSQLLETSQLLQAQADMRKAAQLAPREWRYGKLLTGLLLKSRNAEEAQKIAADYAKAHPENYILGMNYTRALLRNRQYQTAEGVLSKLHILPFEGATDGHRYYEQAKLMLAFDAYKKNKNKVALQKLAESRLWPTQLGAGAPYEEEKQEVLADWLEAAVHGEQQPDKAKALWQKIAGQQTSGMLLMLFKSAALERLGQQEQAAHLQEDLWKRAGKRRDAYQALLSKIRTAPPAAYWEEVMDHVYQSEDQRLF